MEKPNWPILQLTEEKEAFVQQVILQVKENITSTLKKPISYKEILEKTVYQERMRIKEIPWKADPATEEKTWASYKGRLAAMYSSDLSAEELLEQEKELLREIIDGYARQVVGHFNVRTYRFSILAVPILMSRILNGVSGKWFFGIFQKKRNFKDKIKLNGPLEQIKALEQRGTVVFVPTHFSNLDSMLVGYAIYLMGLPPFLYGAGLNLFNNKVVGFFIERLGAYKLDRRKKNVIYLETLKVFSRVALQRGVHTLFFPGGTRSRNGAMESKLKLGLLNSVVEAQRNNYLEGSGKKIFVVPVVIGYHFVLEAPSLIKQHLLMQGKEKVYLERNLPYSTLFKGLTFIWNFLSKGSDIVLSFGKPMDVFGYYVNEQGQSFDAHGKEVIVREYFSLDGKITADKQREAQYTVLLGDRLTQEYKRENIVLSSHVVSFVAFQMIKKRIKDFDIYNTTKLDAEDTALNATEFIEKIAQFVRVLKEMAKNGQLKIDHTLEQEATQIVAEGLQNVGLYHAKKVLYTDKQGRINTQDVPVLYFYHNRLTGYQIEHYV